MILLFTPLEGSPTLFPSFEALEAHLDPSEAFGLDVEDVYDEEGASLPSIISLRGKVLGWVKPVPNP